MLSLGAGYDQRMRNKLIGYVFWQVGRWYVRRRLAALVPSRRVVAAALSVAAVGAVALVVAQRDGGD